MLGDRAASLALGDVTLLPHQRDGVARVRRLLDTHRGALLADDVGLGKTYVALAVARDAGNPLVVAPAALRESWTRSAAAAGVRVAFASVQSLWRRPSTPDAHDLVVIDEAHHLRSRRTRRFAAAAQLCRDARVLLMTATPVQNRLDDLRTILSLFLGQRAWTMDAAALSDHVVRRFERDITSDTRPSLPRVATIATLAAVDDVDCLDRLVALPPPLPPAGGGDGGALVAYTLVRQWSSSRAALVGALRRRLAAARALEDALLAGRYPTAVELAAWCAVDDAQQLAFPELVVQRGATDVAPLLKQVRHHADAVRELLEWLARSANVDDMRSASLRDVRVRHQGARIVAFSEYTDTVVTLYRALCSDPGVAMLTHAGARVAGGRLRRRDILAQFLPGATQPAHERIELLLTTDLLSEGVDLQAAQVLVHLDLSWNPARLEQRVGRLRRIGSPNDAVHVYVMPPPAAAERLLQVERRLRAKLGVAAATVGAAGTILPRLSFAPDAGDARRGERIATHLERWRSPVRAADPPAAAAAYAKEDGAIACVRAGDAHQLVCVSGDQVSDARQDIERALERAHDAEAPLSTVAADAARAAVDRWLAAREVTNVVSLTEVRLARTRRSVLHRVDTIVRRTPRHSQARLAPLMHAARAAAGATLSAGAEQVLQQLATCALDDQAWLQAMGEFAHLHAPPAPAASREIVALLLLVRRA